MINDLKQYGEVIEDIDLKKYNTFKIGGKAKYLVKPQTVNDVKNLIAYLKLHNIKFLVIGNGSNLIFSDNYYDGVIIKLDELNNNEINTENNTVYAEAGVMLPVLAKICFKAGLTGLEWAHGIPGTVGGAVVSNAGAYKEEIFNILKSVTVITPQKEIKQLKKEDIPHGYRTSMFKEQRGYIILAAEFLLEKGDMKWAEAIIEERRSRRVNEQPLDYPSAGSVFRNPDENLVKDILIKYNLKGPYAGHLIEMCGLKGKRIGGAEISSKHANFIVNVDNASANDVKELITLAHDTVLEKYGIDLIIEQEFINWE